MLINDIYIFFAMFTELDDTARSEQTYSRDFLRTVAVVERFGRCCQI